MTSSKDETELGAMIQDWLLNPKAQVGEERTVIGNNFDMLIKAINDWHNKKLVGELEIIKKRLPNPNNNVEEWKGHNLGLSQAITVIELEIDRLQLTKQGDN